MLAAVNKCVERSALMQHVLDAQSGSEIVDLEDGKSNILGLCSWPLLHYVVVRLSDAVAEPIAK